MGNRGLVGRPGLHLGEPVEAVAMGRTGRSDPLGRRFTDSSDKTVTAEGLRAAPTTLRSGHGPARRREHQ